MTAAQEPVPMKPDSFSWNEDLIFSVFGSLLRRQLFAALARKGLQPAIELNTGSEYQISNTVRHLAVMRKAGLVTAADNPGDGRRTLYSLSPVVPVAISESGVVVRFVFPSLVAEMTLSAAGSTKHRDEELVFSVLSDPARRKILLTLARGEPQPAINLCGVVGHGLDVTLKRLKRLRGAGLLTTHQDTKDGRRTLYALSTKVPITTDGKVRVIDFGFCVLRLGS